MPDSVYFDYTVHSKSIVPSLPSALSNETLTLDLRATKIAPKFGRRTKFLSRLYYTYLIVFIYMAQMILFGLLFGNTIIKLELKYF